MVSPCISEDNTCSLYKYAEIEDSNNHEINAGICPKSDKTKAWQFSGGQPILPIDIPFPNNRKVFWCRDGGKICTFPFQIQNEST